MRAGSGALHPFAHSHAEGERCDARLFTLALLAFVTSGGLMELVRRPEGVAAQFR